MTTPVWTELVCHTCSEAHSGRFSFNGRIEVRKLRADAAKRGWLFKHDEVFCSDICLSHYENESQDD